MEYEDTEKKKNKFWSIDGTFKVSPEIFYQLTSIHCLINKKCIPCVFSLFPSKSQKIYEELFKIIKLNSNEEDPQHIMVDFECAEISAARSVFTTTEIHGCFFHLSQSILRRLQNLSLISRYRNDEDLFIDVKKIMALAFLPIDCVIDGFETLQEQLSEDHEELLAYFKNSRTPISEGSSWEKASCLSFPLNSGTCTP